MAIYIVFDVETPNRANARMRAIGITIPVPNSNKKTRSTFRPS